MVLDGRKTGTVLVIVLLLLSLITTTPAPSTAAPGGDYDWMQFNGDPEHSGNNTLETTITPANISGLQKRFQISLPNMIPGAPVYLRDVATPSGVRNMLYATTEEGHIFAIDALSGAIIWSRQYPAGACRVNDGLQPCYTTSSPAIDPNRQYVYTYGLDGRVHKLQVGDGTEITGNGWPQLTTLKPFDEKGSSPLTIATAKNGTSYLYVLHAAYPSDGGDFQGHLTTINLSDGTQKVFNGVCSDQTVHFERSPATPNCDEVGSGIWARAGVVYSPVTDRIYMVTGNAEFDPAEHHWGDSIFALNPDGTGINGDPVDSYTPTNYQEMDDLDIDMGSTAPAILPVPLTSTVQVLAIQGGKDKKLRLLNLADLSGQGGPGHVGGEIGPIIDVPQGGIVFTAPAVWVDPATNDTWTFVSTGRGITAFKVVFDGSGVPSLSNMWQKNIGGTSPLVANGILYMINGLHMYAFDPTTGDELWTDNIIRNLHWQSPIVVNGMLYVPDENQRLTAYWLPSSYGNSGFLPITGRGVTSGW